MDTEHHQYVYEMGPEWKYYDGGLVGQVLETPTSIFEGLKRPGFENGRCYCGKPLHRWTDAQVEVASPEGMVFAAYIQLEAGDSLIVWDWEWLAEDLKKPGHPQSWQTDYRSRTWPKT